MLAPAHVGHLAMLRALIREAAAEGSLDRGLAADTPAAVEFFARLKRALVSGYFVEEDPTHGSSRIGRRSRLRILARGREQRNGARGLRTLPFARWRLRAMARRSRAGTARRRARSRACSMRSLLRHPERRPGSSASRADRATAIRCKHLLSSHGFVLRRRYDAPSLVSSP